MDIAARNVLVGPKSVLKVADFGLTNQMGPSSKVPHALSTRVISLFDVFSVPV